MTAKGGAGDGTDLFAVQPIPYSPGLSHVTGSTAWHRHFLYHLNDILAFTHRELLVDDARSQLWILFRSL